MEMNDLHIEMASVSGERAKLKFLELPPKIIDNI